MTISEPVGTRVDASGPVPAHTEEPTLGAIVQDLSQQIPGLVRSELRLAQAEFAEKGRRAGLGIGMFGAAVAFAGKKQVQQATPAMPERAVAGVKGDIATIMGQRS